MVSYAKNDNSGQENNKFDDSVDTHNKANSSTETPSDSISESNLPTFNKVLVTYEGKDKSNKAINYSIYLSNLSGAEVVILQVIEKIDKLGDTSVNVSNSQSNNTSSSSSSPSTDSQNYPLDIEGKIVESMEEKIKAIENGGAKNKVSYKLRTGSAVDEIVNEVNESNYDLVVLSSSHLDSWIKSLFSDSRKIISNTNIPVLIVQ